MSTRIRFFAALVGALALMSAIGVDVAEAGTYPKGGSYHSGGEGMTLEPSPDPTTLATASFSPQVHGEVPCAVLAWNSCG